MWYIIIVIVLLVGLFLNNFPLDWGYDIQKLLDNFEYYSAKEGRVKKDYYSWTGNKTLKLPIKGKIKYTFSFGQFSKKNKLEFSLNDVEVPKGLTIALRERGKIPEYVEGYILSFSPKSDSFEFDLIIKGDDSNFKTKDIQLVKFNIKGKLFIEQFGVILNNKTINISYEFFVGPDLGHIWVAFDPGTSGSCVATASAGEMEVVIPKDERYNDIIIPSIISFDTSSSPESLYLDDNCSIINPKLYNVGMPPSNPFRKIVSFTSLKKLVGFSDDIEITFQNKKKLTLDGKEMTSLLIGTLNDNISKYVKATDKYGYLLDENKDFNPRRAIVTLPNNFTSTKIQEFINSCSKLEQFKEIRYITESEAILVYNIFEHSRFNDANAPLEDETILVFDMGGSTINISIADCLKMDKNKDEVKYQINIESQMGYGIGGDTIDYCLLKSIFSYEDKYPVLGKNSPFKGLNNVPKEVILQKLLELKKLLIERYYTKTTTQESDLNSLFEESDDFDKKALLTKDELEKFISQIIGNEFIFEDDLSLLRMFQYDHNSGYYPILINKYFLRHVYNPISDIIKEATKLTYGEGSFIDTVIFSGRSTLFPLIKEIAKKVIGNINDITVPDKKISPKVIDFINETELKSVVARGAAYYGLYKNSIEFGQTRLSSSFGIRKTNSAGKHDVEFIELLKTGMLYNKKSTKGVLFCEGSTEISSKFSFDANFIHFYQVMGSDPENIILQKEKHKYSKTGSIKLNINSKKVGTQVYWNDLITSYVINEASERIETNQTQYKSQIFDENDEHYTWIFR